MRSSPHGIPSPGRYAAPCVATGLRTVLLTGVLASLAGCDAFRSPPVWHGAALDPPTVAAALHLPIAPGGAGHVAPDTFNLSRVTADSGRAALVFFGYTHCPDVCPTTLADWTRVKRTLAQRDPADTARVRFVFVTVDPERDSAAVVGRYLAQFDPGFIGLVGSRAAVDAAQQAWGVASSREPAGAGRPGDAYTVAHSAQFFIVGPRGRLRLVYGLGARPADIADDLHQLLAESPARSMRS